MTWLKSRCIKCIFSIYIILYIYIYMYVYILQILQLCPAAGVRETLLLQRRRGLLLLRGWQNCYQVGLSWWRRASQGGAQGWPYQDKSASACQQWRMYTNLLLYCFKLLEWYMRTASKLASWNGSGRNIHKYTRSIQEVCKYMFKICTTYAKMQTVLDRHISFIDHQ